MDDDQDYLDGLNLVSTECYNVPSKIKMGGTQNELLKQIGLELAASAVFTGKVDVKASSKSLQRLYLRHQASQQPSSFNKSIHHPASVPVSIRPATGRSHLPSGHPTGHTVGPSRHNIGHHSSTPQTMPFQKVHSVSSVNPYLPGSGNAYLRETLQQPTGTYRYNPATGQTILYQASSSSVVRGLGIGSSNVNSNIAGIWHPSSSHHNSPNPQVTYMRAGGASVLPQHNGPPPTYQQSIILQPAGPIIQQQQTVEPTIQQQQQPAGPTIQQHPSGMVVQTPASSIGPSQLVAIKQTTAQSDTTGCTNTEPNLTEKQNAIVHESVVKKAPLLELTVCEPSPLSCEVDKSNDQKQNEGNQVIKEHKENEARISDEEKSTVSANLEEGNINIHTVEQQNTDNRKVLDPTVTITCTTSIQESSKIALSNSESTPDSSYLAVGGRVMPPPLSYMGGTPEGGVSRSYPRSTTTPPSVNKVVVPNIGVLQAKSMAPPTLLRHGMQPPVAPSQVTHPHTAHWSQPHPAHMIGVPVQSPPMYSPSHGSHGGYGGYSYVGHMQGGYMTSGYMQGPPPPPHSGHMVIHGGSHISGLIRQQGLPHNHYAYVQSSPHSLSSRSGAASQAGPLHHGSGYVIPSPPSSHRGSSYQGVVPSDHLDGDHMLPGSLQRTASQGTPSPGTASSSGTPGTTPSPGGTPSPGAAIASPGFISQTGSSLGLSPRVSPGVNTPRQDFSESAENKNLPKIKQEILASDYHPLTLDTANVASFKHDGLSDNDGKTEIEVKTQQVPHGDLSVNEFINTLKPSTNKSCTGYFDQHTDIKENTQDDFSKTVLMENKLKEEFHNFAIS
ncbi:unnamed protein product, partial [Meganyctiphanes norvegica]